MLQQSPFSQNVFVKLYYRSMKCSVSLLLFYLTQITVQYSKYGCGFKAEIFPVPLVLYITFLILNTTGIDRQSGHAPGTGGVGVFKFGGGSSPSSPDSCWAASANLTYMCSRADVQTALSIIMHVVWGTSPLLL